ncbi:MAG: hypothetical protein JXR36_13365 [Bacteroidales bacterium]|nr:hypothetical protein [Bacteroidales bacterium]
MEINKDYFIVPSFVQNDFESGEILRGRLLCTKKYVFVIISGETRNGYEDDIKIENMLNIADMIDVVDFEVGIMELLFEKDIIRIDSLDSFSIHAGFLLGNISYKKPNGFQSVIEIKGREIRKSLKAFYQDCL